MGRIDTRKRFRMIESSQMRRGGGVWNIRSLNKVGRLKCLTDFINQSKLDFVGIQETMKSLYRK
jgi:hypothetical protein